MAWLPIATTPPQYHYQGEPASGFVLKFYRAGGSTNILLATDNTGGTTATDVVLNAEGFPEVSGSVIIPHLEESYKIALYASQAAADADTGALWNIDNLTPPVNSVNAVDELVKVSSNDTTADTLDSKVVSGTNITVTEENDGGNESISINLDDDVVISGTYNGRDVAADGAILDAIGVQNVKLNTKVLEIGDWDMSVAGYARVSHGLSDVAKIRTITASVRDDAGTVIVNLDLSGGATTSVMYGISTYIQLNVGASGVFAGSSDYNQLSYNRGWVTIQYVD